MNRGLSSDERGLTLVELIVAIVISGFVVGMLALVFINGWSAQQRTAARDLATSEANAVAAQLIPSVRNSTAMRINTAGTRLDLTVLTDAGTWECRAWAVTTVSGKSVVRYASRAGAAVAADGSTLKTIASGATATLTGSAAFATTGTRGLKIGIRFTQGSESVDLRNTITAQAVKTGAPSC